MSARKFDRDFQLPMAFGRLYDVSHEMDDSRKCKVIKYEKLQIRILDIEIVQNG
jgi:hypothetical protein